MKVQKTFVIAIGMLLVAGCTNIKNDGLKGIWMDNLVDQSIYGYTVKTGSRGEMVGEDIFIYDGDNNLIFALGDNEDPQYFFAIEGKYLIVDFGTSAGIREVKIYDIESKNVIFDGVYVSTEESLVLTDTGLNFYQKLDTNTIDVLPICENEYDNGYVSLYTFDFNSLTVHDVGIKKCIYFE